MPITVWDVKRIWRYARRRVEEPLAVRFWARVEKTSTCWIWRGHIHNKGYGRFYDGRRKWLAHRFAWLLKYGKEPRRLGLHKCNNKLCVRVHRRHVYEGTHADNARQVGGLSFDMSLTGPGGWLPCD